jgi:hypothetical protein
VHQFLREKVRDAPHIDFVSMVAQDGQLINFSRFWPVADLNVADREFFKVLREASIWC